MKLILLEGFFYIEKRTDNTKPKNIFSVIYEKNCISYIFSSNTFSNKAISWRCLKIEGSLDFAVAGILVKVLNPLAINNISVLVSSSFDTDYIYIKHQDIDNGINILRNEGFIV